ncbi:ATP-binding cassette domain-containing protein [Rhizobium beringeri]
MIGPSGSGKSTLIRCVNLLETYQGGQVRVNGAPVGPDKVTSAARAEMGMVFQSFNLFPHLTAAQNVALGPIRVRKMSTGVASALAHDLLGKVGLAQHSDKYPRSFQGASSSVWQSPELRDAAEGLLFDEPTSALDPKWSVRCSRSYKALPIPA